MNAKVLLVDDEPAVCACVATALKRFGFSVTTANSGEGALEILAHDSFDLVVTDYRMPGIGGAGVIRALRERRDEVSVILITGLADELPARLRTGPEAVRILPKPFTLLHLRREVEAELRARAVVSPA